METNEEIGSAGKVPRKEKVLYFLRFHAWSMIAIGIAWFVYFAVAVNGLGFDLFLFSLAVFVLFLCVTRGALALRVAKVDEGSWVDDATHLPCPTFLIKVLCVILAGIFASLCVFGIYSARVDAQATIPRRLQLGVSIYGSCAWYFIGACSFWSAIGRILNKLERRK